MEPLPSTLELPPTLESADSLKDPEDEPLFLIDCTPVENDNSGVDNSTGIVN